MNRKIKRAALCPLTASLFCLLCISVLGRVQTGTAAPHTENRAIAEADCSAEKLGATIPVSAIGEQVSGVTLGAGQSVGATKAGNRNIIPITGETR